MKKVFNLEEIKKSQKINLIDGTYTHIRAYHACRPISIDDYLLNGIRPISYESALDEVKSRVVCKWVSENTGLSSKVCKFFFTPLSAASCGIGC